MYNNDIKKYKSVLKDDLRNIRYEFYSNKKLNKKQKIKHVRQYIYKNDFKIPEYGSKIMIICD
jgi:hypothetical protein